MNDRVQKHGKGRLYVCPIIGDGSGENNIRSAATDKPGVITCRSAIASIMTGPNRGKPKYPWTICWVQADDWTAIEADSSFILLSDREVDSLEKTIDANKKTVLKTSRIISQQESDTINTDRDIIRLLVKKHYPHTDEKGQFGEIT